MNIEIKKLTRDDWQVYKELRLQMLTEEPQAYSQTLEELENRFDQDWIDKTVADNMAILAAWVDGKLAGMSGLFYEEKDVVAIWGVFVRKEFRGIGLGEKLIEETEKEIIKDKGVKRIQIEVTVTQIPAWQLYKKLGFKEIGRKKGATKLNGELFDEIILEKNIPQS